MPQFHESRMGVKFFEVDLPRLLVGLEKLAAVLDKHNTHPADKPDLTNGVAEYRLPRPNQPDRVLWRRGLVAKDGLLYQDGRMLSAKEGDAVAHEYGLAYAEQLVKRLSDQPEPAIHEWPVQAVLKQIPHLSFEERCVLFEAITRGYCQWCGRPIRGTPMEAQCECHAWIDGMRNGFKTLTDAQRIQLLRVMSQSWCMRCGKRRYDKTTAELERGAACTCGLDVDSCTDPDNCARCKGDKTKPHAGIP